MKISDKYGTSIKIDKEVKKLVVEHSNNTGLSKKKAAEILIKKGFYNAT